LESKNCTDKPTKLEIWLSKIHINEMLKSWPTILVWHWQVAFPVKTEMEMAYVWHLLVGFSIKTEKSGMYLVSEHCINEV